MRLPKASEVFTALLSILFTFFLLEIVARVWYANFASQAQLEKYGMYDQVPQKAWQMQRHHYLNYSLTPNYKKEMIQHNALGYRGAAFKIEKPDSVYRIACLGGSTTYSSFVRDDAKTYPALLEKILKETYDYKNLEVINAGVPGYNSWESLINLEFRVLDLNPDLIIIYHGTNDVHPRLIAPESYRGDNSGRRKQWEYPKIAIYDKSALLRFLRRHIGYTTQIGLESLITPEQADVNPDAYKTVETLEKNPPVFFQRNLKSMIGIANINKIETLLTTWAYNPKKGDYAASKHYMQGFEENNTLIKALGDSLNVPVFDFAAKMSADVKYWEDGRHVNYDGAQLKAELFAEFIHQQQLIPESNQGREK